MMDSREAKWIQWAFMGVLLCLCSRTQAVHPFHISFAEIEFNQKNQCFEVALKLHASDLDKVLSNRLKRTVDVEKDEVDESIQQYLNGHFYLLPEEVAKAEKIDAKTPLSKLNFVGKEMEDSWIWIYFELQPPKSEKPLALVNTVFLDLVKDQINTVSIRAGKKRHAVKMTSKTPWHPFNAGWKVATNKDNQPKNSTP
ncbi:MAG: DUF6702 family protein [Planctomycetota bacterium]